MQGNIVPPPGRICLLSPLGLSPGLLYSALLKIRPDLAVIISSAQALNAFPEILRRSEFNRDLETFSVTDPFLCFEELPGLISLLRSIALPRDEWYVNLTGGTTALQYLIQKAGDDLFESGFLVHTVAFIDRRGVDAQKQNPWVMGEMVSVP